MPQPEGYVDGIRDGRVIGWAWRPDRPLEPILVDLHVDDRQQSSHEAHLYRADLEAAGKGNGRHGFEVQLPPSLPAGSRVRLVVGGTALDLHGSPIAITAQAAPAFESAQLPPGVHYRSRFGGLWPDRSDVALEIDRRQTSGALGAVEVDLFRRWVTDGFVVLPGVIPASAIDRLESEVDAIWSGRSSHRCFVEVWENDVKTIRRVGPAFRDYSVKLLDLHDHLAVAREIAFNPRIVRFLTLLFEQTPLAFQSLYFRWGSRQDIHQDTAFVRVSSPMCLAACWIALEDIAPDSGELEYYVGSHQLEDYLFEGHDKWMPFRSSEYAAFVESLHDRSRARGLRLERFRARKGDALVWSADLAHGGSKVVRPGVTRKVSSRTFVLLRARRFMASHETESEP